MKFELLIKRLDLVIILTGLTTETWVFFSLKKQVVKT